MADVPRKVRWPSLVRAHLLGRIVEVGERKFMAHWPDWGRLWAVKEFTPGDRHIVRYAHGGLKILRREILLNIAAPMIGTATSWPGSVRDYVTNVSRSKVPSRCRPCQPQQITFSKTHRARGLTRTPFLLIFGRPFAIPS